MKKKSTEVLALEAKVLLLEAELLLQKEISAHNHKCLLEKRKDADSLYVEWVAMEQKWIEAYKQRDKLQLDYDLVLERMILAEHKLGKIPSFIKRMFI